MNSSNNLYALENPEIENAFFFRQALNAISTPGKIFDLSCNLNTPNGLSKSAGSLLLCLCDFDTPIFLSETFNTDLNSKKIFKENIKKCTNKTNFKLIEENFKEVNYSKIGKFNIYFYDGPHHKEDHFDGVNLVQSCLEKKYILIIDDWNWLQVRKGTLEALNNESIELISKIEIRTTQDNSRAIIEGKFSEWHNGYFIAVCSKK